MKKNINKIVSLSLWSTTALSSLAVIGYNIYASITNTHNCLWAWMVPTIAFVGASIYSLVSLGVKTLNSKKTNVIAKNK